MKGINELGNRYGKLLVVSRALVKNRKAYWTCKCDCGNIHIVRADRLRSGMADNCGCESYNKRLDSRGLKQNDSAFNNYMSTYVSNSKRKNIEFLLTKKQFKELTSSPCHYCGNPPSKYYIKRSGRGEYLCNGIDRIDSTKGYTYENSLPCCQDCNYTKSSATYAYFLSKIELIYSNLIMRVET